MMIIYDLCTCMEREKVYPGMHQQGNKKEEEEEEHNNQLQSHKPFG